MANHLRQQIREAVGAKLLALLTTGANVFQSRIYPLKDTELPALLIFSLSEQINGRSEGSHTGNVPRMTERTLQIVVRAVCKTVANYDDVLDTICKEVEAKLATDRFLAGLTDDLRLMRTVVTLSGDGDKPLGVAEMLWEVDYWVNETTPDIRS